MVMVILAGLGTRGRLENALSSRRRVVLRMMIGIAGNGSQVFPMGWTWFAGRIPGHRWRRLFLGIGGRCSSEALAARMVAMQLRSRRNMYMASPMGKAI